MTKRKEKGGLIDADLASRRLKAAGELKTPATETAYHDFLRRTKLSEDQKDQLAQLVDTCRNEGMQIARKLIDGELAAYIERSTPYQCGTRSLAAAARPLDSGGRMESADSPRAGG